MPKQGWVLFCFSLAADSHLDCSERCSSFRLRCMVLVSAGGEGAESDVTKRSEVSFAATRGHWGRCPCSSAQVVHVMLLQDPVANALSRPSTRCKYTVFVPCVDWQNAWPCPCSEASWRVACCRIFRYVYKIQRVLCVCVCVCVCVCARARSRARVCVHVCVCVCVQVG